MDVKTSTLYQVSSTLGP